MNSAIEKRLIDLEDVVRKLLNSGNKSPFKPLIWIDDWAKKMGIENQVDSCEVFMEAYLRTKKSIEEGRQIENYVGWLRYTCSLVLKEYRTEIIRDKIRIEKLARNQSAIKQENSLYEETIPEFVNEENIRTLRKAKEFLSKQDNEILSLRVVGGMEWKEIQKQLNNEVSIVALRKRGERAVKRLKDAFYAIKGKEDV